MTGYLRPSLPLGLTRKSQIDPHLFEAIAIINRLYRELPEAVHGIDFGLGSKPAPPPLPQKVLDHARMHLMSYFYGFESLRDPSIPEEL